MNEEIKNKIRTIMMDYLKTLGWPDCPNPNEVIMNNLQPMFQLLLKENLVKYQDYDSYMAAAQLNYMRQGGV